MALDVQGSFDDLGTPLSEVTFAVIDVETTGGSPTDGSLTEVAAASYRGGQLLRTYRTFVRPDQRIPPFITALTGINDVMVADAPPAGAALSSLLEFVGGAVLVGHNIRFDLSFLDHALVDTGRPRLSDTHCVVDTLALARRLVRQQTSDCKLATLAAGLRLEHRPSHRALDDVLATGDLLHALLERAGSYGIVGLAELLDLPKLVGHPQASKLRLTTRLPHHPGVYWFTDAAGDVLYVGKAADLQGRVRSYFTGDRRPKVGRLLRQLHAVHHRITPGTLTASVIEGRLIRAWAPPFNRAGRRRGTSSRPAPTVGHKGRLVPVARRMWALAAEGRYEAAAAARDEGEQLRQRLIRQRWIASIRRAGHVVLHVHGTSIGDEIVALRDGVVVDDMGFPPLDPSDGAAEATIVADWVRQHSDHVRVIDVGEVGEVGGDGLWMPADRIPLLTEITREPERTRQEPAAAGA